MQIHVSKDGQQLGPFTWEQVQEQLAAGTIVPTDYAWHEGLEEWAALSELKPPQETVPEMGIQSTKSNDALPQPKQHSKLKTAFGFLLLLAVLGLPLIACSFSLLDYNAVKKDGASLFFALFPFHYLYILFPAISYLVFVGLLGFFALGVYLLWPLGGRSKLVKIPAYGLMGFLIIQLLGTGIFYVGYNFTGNRAWNQYRESQLADSNSYYKNWESVLVNKKVPDEQNFAMTPLFAPLNGLESELDESGDGSRFTGESGEIFKSADAKIRESFPEILHSSSKEDRKPGVVYIIKPGSRDQDKKYEGNWREGKVLSLPNLYLAMPSLAPHRPNLPLAVKGRAILSEFAKYDAGFNEIEKAAQRPHFQFHSEYDLFTLLPELGILKGVSRWFGIRASVRLVAGASPGALQDIKTILSICDGLNQEPALISHLVALTLSSYALTPLFEGLVMRAWSEEQLAELELVLSKFDWLEAYRVVVVSDLAGINHTFDKVLKGNAFEKKVFINSIFPGPVTPAFYIPGWVRRNQMNYNKAATDLAPLLVDFESRRVHAEESIENPIPKLGYHYFILGQQDPRGWLSSTLRKFSRTQIDLNLARVAIALERYQLKEKSYPNSLEALVPTYLKSVPHDIMDGKPLRYVRKQNAYQLYSVGWNQKEEGGAYDKDSRKGDWIWYAKANNPEALSGLPAGGQLPPGKTFAWTAGVNQQSLDRFYVGKSQAQVQKIFGKPDQTQGQWWGYTGLNITNAQGTKYSTAWFGFTNGVVQQVRIDK